MKAIKHCNVTIDSAVAHVISKDCFIYVTFDTMNSAVVSVVLFVLSDECVSADTEETLTQIMKHYFYVHFLPLNSLSFVGFFFCFMTQMLIHDTYHEAHNFLLTVSEMFKLLCSLKLWSVSL